MIWIEKYRPDNFDDIVGQDKNISIINKMIEGGSFPHLLLHGKSGTGKTSTIMSIANKLYGKNKPFMMIKLDASDDRGINTVREEIKGFAEKMTPFNTGIKLIILDEADSMTFDAQFALRRIIEKYSDDTRFCIICNYMNKIIAPIKARCVNLRFYPIDKKIIVERLKFICQEEKLKYEKNSLEIIANISNGDLRKAINILQSLSMMTSKNKICIESCYNSAGIPPPNVINELYSILINKDVNFETTYKYLEDNIISQGYTLNFLLQELNKIIIENNNTNNDDIINYIEEIAELEYMVAQSIFNEMYIVGLVAIFKKSP
uniref:AAA+ ATPase domain-containing protein n=1 Tax=viral metagenome TaxID=1070528 RepID=A0A6C0HV92_9ZZZZ